MKLMRGWFLWMRFTGKRNRGNGKELRLRRTEASWSSLGLV
jgi:hypothetical protein